MRRVVKRVVPDVVYVAHKHDGARVQRPQKPAAFVATKGVGASTEWVNPFVAQSMARARERYAGFDIHGPFATKAEAFAYLSKWKDQGRRYERQERCTDAREMSVSVSVVADRARAVREALAHNGLSPEALAALAAMDAAVARTRDLSDGQAAKALAYVADRTSPNSSTEATPESSPKARKPRRIVRTDSERLG